MKVCYRAGTVTQENGIAHIQTNAVEIRVLFLTDDIVRIRAGFDGDWDEASYSLAMTAWDSRTDELLKDYRKNSGSCLPAGFERQTDSQLSD